MDLQTAAKMIFKGLEERSLIIAAHGNGFLQTQTHDGYRFHFFGDSAIPRQRVYTGIHDHRFGFLSTILCGALVNAVYAIDTDPMDQVFLYTVNTYKADPTALADTKLFRHPGYPDPVALFTVDVARHDCGTTYAMPPKQLHETFVAEQTITYLEKTESLPSYDPLILCPDGREPDNSFDRASFDFAYLAGIVSRMLNAAL